MMFTFLENAVNLGIFIHVFLTTQNSHPSSCYHTLDRLKLHSPKQNFFEDRFHLAAERGGGNYDLLYHNSISKFEDDSEH